MLPFKLSPAFKDYLWGGTKLKTSFGKQSSLPILAESWELSAHNDGSSIIASGEHTGMPFNEFVQKYPKECGTNCAGMDRFPILIKLIDAKQSLSIQVHPDDEYGYKVEKEPGKTEMWVVLDCEPDAFLFFGFERPIEKEEMARRIQDNSLPAILHKAPVKKGDVFFIKAGTIHAIGAGIVLAEIQQNSNTTYRVYDFGRLGPDGNPRKLHTEKALEVTSLAPANMQAPGETELQIHQGYSWQRLASCEYFTVDRLFLTDSYTKEMDGSSFVSVLCTKGTALLCCNGAQLKLTKGDSAFVPASNQGFELQGEGEFLLSSL